MKFKYEDCVTEVINLRPPGGQHVGTAPTGIKVTHIPTGLYAYCDSARSQHKNRDIAFQMVEYGVACIE